MPYSDNRSENSSDDSDDSDNSNAEQLGSMVVCGARGEGRGEKGACQEAIEVTQMLDIKVDVSRKGRR